MDLAIGFLCDHVEVLYDIDIAFQETARNLGVKLIRAESLNDSPLLIEALEDLALYGKDYSVAGSLTSEDEFVREGWQSRTEQTLAPDRSGVPNRSRLAREKISLAATRYHLGEVQNLDESQTARSNLFKQFNRFWRSVRGAIEVHDPSLHGFCLNRGQRAV